MSDPIAAPATPGQPAEMHRTATDDPGLALGIAALASSFFIQIVGLVLGIIALQQSKQAGFQNPTAIAAIIVSAGMMVLTAVIIIVTVLIVLFTVGVAAVLIGMDPTLRY